MACERTLAGDCFGSGESPRDTEHSGCAVRPGPVALAGWWGHVAETLGERMVCSPGPLRVCQVVRGALGARCVRLREELPWPFGPEAVRSVAT
jgi:hypothetical protein